MSNATLHANMVSMCPQRGGELRPHGAVYRVFASLIVVYLFADYKQSGELAAKHFCLVPWTGYHLIL